MSDDWADFIIKETDTVIISWRVRLDAISDRAFSFDPVAKNIIGYHAECKRHQIMVEIGARDAGRIEDSMSFCRQCQAGEAQILPRLGPELEKLKKLAIHNNLIVSMDSFIDTLDVDEL